MTALRVPTLRAEYVAGVTDPERHRWLDRRTSELARLRKLATSQARVTRTWQKPQN